jgi:stearoyl-CoA desaturase (Delta-9 desaturase)
MSESRKVPAFLASILTWVGFPLGQQATDPAISKRFDWVRAMPFFGMHLGCLGVLLVGWSWLAITIAAALYAARVFALTAFYHRYFAHRSFRTWRIVQFFFAVVGCAAVQRGPLWWAAHHRHHHAHSDDEEDLHSPRQHGLIWSHCAWFLTGHAFPLNAKLVPDLLRYPELRFIDRFDMLVPALLAIGLFGFGELVDFLFPAAGVTGMQLLVWGFFISTVAVYHVTFLVNSATHLVGTRRFATKDDSRNSLVIALLTFGEGWHNNHHHYPNSARQGFYWWEIDISYYGLRFLSMLGLVWDIRPVPNRVLRDAHKPAALPADAKPQIAN